MTHVPGKTVKNKLQEENRKMKTWEIDNRWSY